MVWQGRARQNRLPPDWHIVRARILERDRYTCRRCGAFATHVDHLEAGTTGPVPDDQLQALCEPCHVLKSAGEGGRATAARYRRRVRNPRPHPGMIDPTT